MIDSIVLSSMEFSTHVNERDPRRGIAIEKNKSLMMLTILANTQCKHTASLFVDHCCRHVISPGWIIVLDRSEIYVHGILDEAVRI